MKEKIENQASVEKASALGDPGLNKSSKERKSRDENNHLIFVGSRVFVEPHLPPIVGEVAQDYHTNEKTT